MRREGEVGQPWGRGSGVQVYCALPLPSLYIEAGGAPKAPQVDLGLAHQVVESNLAPQVDPYNLGFDLILWGV